MSTLAGSAERVVRPTRGGIQTSTMIMGLLTVFVAVMTVTPVAVALVASFRTAPVGQPGVWTVSGIVNVARDPATLRVVWTTLWMGLLRAGLATLIAVMIAWILARTDCPFRGQLEVVLLLSFFFPIVGRILGWAVLLSPRTGYINQLLRVLPFFSGRTGPLNIFSYPGSDLRQRPWVLRRLDDPDVARIPRYGCIAGRVGPHVGRLCSFDALSDHRPADAPRDSGGVHPGAGQSSLRL